MTEQEPDIVERANNVVLGYAYREIKQGEHNLLSAAIKCGCKACVHAFMTMVEFFCGGDPKTEEHVLEKLEYKGKRG